VVTHGAIGEMPEVLPIYAAAIVLGLIYGFIFVNIVIINGCRFSLRVIMVVVALASILGLLLAAKPKYWTVTVGFWALAAAVMTVIDLAIICMIDPWLNSPRLSKQSVAWIVACLPFASIGILTAILVSLDLGPNARKPLKLLAGVIVVSAPVALIDIAGRITAIGWTRWRRTGRHSSTRSGDAVPGSQP
jgi:hypothetical protein